MASQVLSYSAIREHTQRNFFEHVFLGRDTNTDTGSPDNVSFPDFLVFWTKHSGPHSPIISECDTAYLRPKLIAKLTLRLNALEEDEDVDDGNLTTILKITDALAKHKTQQQKNDLDAAFCLNVLGQIVSLNVSSLYKSLVDENPGHNEVALRAVYLHLSQYLPAPSDIKKMIQRDIQSTGIASTSHHIVILMTSMLIHTLRSSKYLFMVNPDLELFHKGIKDNKEAVEANREELEEYSDIIRRRRNNDPYPPVPECVLPYPLPQTDSLVAVYNVLVRQYCLSVRGNRGNNPPRPILDLGRLANPPPPAALILRDPSVSDFTAREILEIMLTRMDSSPMEDTNSYRPFILDALAKTPVTPLVTVFASMNEYMARNLPSANHTANGINAASARIHAPIKSASHSAFSLPFGQEFGGQHPMMSAAASSTFHGYPQQHPMMSAAASSTYHGYPQQHPSTHYHTANTASTSDTNEYGKRIAEIQDQSRYVKPATPCNFWGPVIPGGPLQCGREIATGSCPFQQFHMLGVTRPPQKWLTPSELAQQRASQLFPTSSDSSQSGLGQPL